jgi:hypothetical protein
MKKTLQAFPNLVTKEEVRRKVMVDPFVIKLVSNFGIIFLNAITKRKLMTRLVQFFSKVKRPYTSTQLITKHIFFTIVLGNDSQTLSRQKVWLFNVHPRNLAKVAHHLESMNSARGFFWSLEEEGKCLAFRTKTLIFIIMGFSNAMTLMGEWVSRFM